MRAFIYCNFLMGFSTACLAAVPNNGVMQTNRSLNSILNENDSDSAYHQCISQSRGARYFSGTCPRLMDTLRKKMNMMALEADLQMQAEKISEKPVPKAALFRIAMLAKINLLSTQAEETIKATEDIADIVASVKKVQISVDAYSKLF